jgi:hypothetical protein
MVDPPNSWPLPAWYVDPSGDHAWRWWDGRGWSGHVAPAGIELDTHRISQLLDAEKKAARRARFAALGYLAIVAFEAIDNFANAAQWRNYFHLTRLEIDRAFSGATPHPANMPPNPVVGTSGEWILQLLTVLSLVIFLNWQFRSSAVARNLGYGARRSPGWGVGVWFIPIVNLWKPYQSLRDLPAPRHSLRQMLLVGWLLFIFTAGLVGAGPVLAYVDLPVRTVILTFDLGAIVLLAWISWTFVSGAVLCHQESFEHEMARSRLSAR